LPNPECRAPAAGSATKGPRRLGSAQEVLHEPHPCRVFSLTRWRVFPTRRPSTPHLRRLCQCPTAHVEATPSGRIGRGPLLELLGLGGSNMAERVRRTFSPTRSRPAPMPIPLAGPRALGGSASAHIFWILACLGIDPAYHLPPLLAGAEVVEIGNCSWASDMTSVEVSSPAGCSDRGRKHLHHLWSLGQPEHPVGAPRFLEPNTFVSGHLSWMAVDKQIGVRRQTLVHSPARRRIELRRQG